MQDRRSPSAVRFDGAGKGMRRGHAPEDEKLLAQQKGKMEGREERKKGVKQMGEGKGRREEDGRTEWRRGETGKREVKGGGKGGRKRKE